MEASDTIVSRDNPIPIVDFGPTASGEFADLM